MEVKSRSVSAIEYARICGVALLHRRHFEYRHMQLSYLNKALLFIKLYGILKKKRYLPHIVDVRMYYLCVVLSSRVLYMWKDGHLILNMFI